MNYQFLFYVQKNVYTIFVRLRIRVTVMTVQRAASPCTPQPLFLLLRVWITTAWSSGYIHYKNVELWQQFAFLPTGCSFDSHADIVWYICVFVNCSRTLNLSGKQWWCYFFSDTGIVYFKRVLLELYYSISRLIGRKGRLIVNIWRDTKDLTLYVNHYNVVTYILAI